MKTAVFLMVAVIVGAVIGVAPVFLDADRNGIPSAYDADLSAFSPKLLKDRPGDSYDAVFKLTPNTGKDAVIRLFSDVHGDRKDYLAIEISANKIRAIAVESGILQELAASSADFSPGFPAELRLRRRTPYLDLVCDGKCLLQVSHRGFADGQVGYGAKNAEVSDPVVQPVDSIVFTDDFMRASGESGGWVESKGSNWEVRSIDNPARSSNAFIYQGLSSKGGISLIGRPYWNSYRAEVSVFGEKDSEVGLVVSASNLPVDGELPDRFCYARWTSEPTEAEKAAKKGDDKPAITEKAVNAEEKADNEAKESPRLEIVLVENKKPRVIAVRDGGFTPGRWYRLAATLNNCQVTVSIDGNKFLSASDPKLSGGCSGLYVKSNDAVEYDDFRLVSVNNIDADKDSGAVWEFLGGAWEDAGGVLQVTATGEPAMAITGSTAVRDMKVSVDIEAADSLCGVVACFRDPGNYLAYAVNPKTKRARILRCKSGKVSILGEGEFDGKMPLTMEIDRGYVTAGNLSAFVPDLKAGQGGLYFEANGKDAAKSTFSKFSIRSIDPPLPQVSVNEVFDDESLMKIWSGASGDWQVFKQRPSGFTSAYWHRARIYGDCEIEATIPAERPTASSIYLSLAKPDVSKTSNNGYVLRLEEKEDGVSLALIREGEEVATYKVESGVMPNRVRFRQCGNFIAAYVDDAYAVSWEDKEPLSGSKVAWATKAIKIDAEDVRIYSRSLQNYSFNSAPADWRQAGGVWQVTNRWECDPRWSFMAGMPAELALKRSEALSNKLTDNGRWLLGALKKQLELAPDHDSKLAAIWHKGEFNGDVVAECFVGQMMDQSRGGGSYERYVKNMALSICADGKDLDSGYTCVFGEDNNSKSVILRHGKVVAEIPVGIPVKRNIHRKWFRMRAEKLGGDITFRVFVQDNPNSPEVQLVSLRYTDPEPLGGGRVAVWTYDNGIMVARMRISSPDEAVKESPFISYPLLSGCHYDAGIKTETAKKE